MGDLPVQLGQAAAGGGHHLHQQGGGVDAVFALDVAPDGEAAGALAADDRPGLQHLARDVLEAHRDLVALLAEPLRNGVQQVGGGQVAHRRPVPALVLQQVVVQQHQNLVGVEELPPVVDNAQPVGVAVGGDADVAAVLQHEVLQANEGLAVGSGEAASEEGVPPLVDYVHVAPGGDENGLESGLGHAVHGVQHNLQPPGADGVHVHRPDYRVDIGVHGVDNLYLARAHPLLIGDSGDFLSLQGGDVGLDVGGDQLIGVSASLDKHLHPVVQGGVVAGGDRHAAGQLVILHGEHDKGRGSLPLHHHTGHACSRHHLGGPVGRLLGEEPPVVADEEAPLGHPLLFHLPGQSRGKQLDVGLGEAVADDGPPAAGSEFDVAHCSSLLPMVTIT